MRAGALLLVLLFQHQGRAQSAERMPLAVIISASAAQVRSAGDSGSLEARPGVLLYKGDTLLGQGGAVTFAFCPDKTLRELTGHAVAVVESGGIRTQGGAAAIQKQLPFCRLPQIERNPVAAATQYETRGPGIALEGTFQSRMAVLPTEQREHLLRELAPVAQALARDPRDRLAQLARAVILQEHGMNADAAAEYQNLQGVWEEAMWTRGVVVNRQRRAAQAAQGKTYALLVGISNYENRTVPRLRYADKDAEMFAEYLRSKRGGALSDSQLMLLTNEKATSEAIRLAIGSFLAERAGENDTVLLFIAGHGMVASTARDPVTGEKSNPEGFVLTHKSDPEDLLDTAIPMQEIRDVTMRHLSKVGRVLVYVDVCRSGNIGVITEKNTITLYIQTALRDSEGKLSTLMASQPQEYAFEAPEFGGGHGAFTYFLLRGLNGEADKLGDKNGIVTSGELIRFIEHHVPDATWDEQHPDKVNFLRDRTPLANLEDEGITVGQWSKLPERIARGYRGARGFAPGGQQTTAEQASARAEESLFVQALNAGRVLPGTSDSAFEMLQRLRVNGYAPERLQALEDQLRVQLENLGQDVLIRYVKGDQLQSPQTESDFANGARYFRAALQLAPAALLDQSRALFCEGRVLIFRKQYDGAVALLERAVRLDPMRPYAYNALGIAYLEQASRDKAYFSRAEHALMDAIRRGPYWTYPLHNLALLETERGSYGRAIATYKQAMRLAPQYSYLPYNLAVLYQRLHRTEDALESYTSAVGVAAKSCQAAGTSRCAERAEPLNGLASLYTEKGRGSKARLLYEEALREDPTLIAARHNLAQLLARHPRTAPESEVLWRENLARDPRYLPSLLSLAEYAARQGRNAEAVRLYLDVLRERPQYGGARRVLSALLLESGDAEGSLRQAELGLESQPGEAGLLEQKGAALEKLGRIAEARKFYEGARAAATDPAARKRIDKVLKRIMKR